MDDIRIYLKYYSNYTFLEEPFNEVDNVIFSLLSYVDFKGIVPTCFNGSITLSDASKLYWDKHSKLENNLNVTAVRKAAYVLKKMEGTKRYKDLILYNYEYKYDSESQFGALCIKGEFGIYVSYEGTDGLISGWEEDFKLSHIFPTASQKHAIEYLNNVIKYNDKNVLVGGHSKGGNLAMVAAMYCKPKLRKKIKCIYNNDGPGLRKEEFESKNYKEIYPKLKTYIPEHSLVGLLLRHSDNYIVVSSLARGILQHDPSTWCCYGGHFVRTRISKSSQKLENSILNWLDKYDDEKREKFVKVLFDVFRSAGITDLKEFKMAKLKSAFKILSSTKVIDSDTKNMAIDCIKTIISEM